MLDSLNGEIMKPAIFKDLPTIAAVVVLFACLCSSRSQAQSANRAPCIIQILDRETRWPVPLVELRTNHQVRLITDNAGRIAFDLPELMNQETWFTIESDGYEVPADGFGFRGARVTPKPGAHIVIEIDRTSLARRLGRLTGAGLYAESQKAGLELDWSESGILGSDSVQNALHRGKMFWAWGDTTLARYPLGIFHMTSATTPIQPLEKFEPPIKLPLDYFTDAEGRPRAVATMPGEGPTWLSGYVSLPDADGDERLVGAYVKVKPPMEIYQSGLCVWNDERAEFEHLRTLWTKSRRNPEPPPMPDGHPVVIEDQGKRWVLFGDPFPKLRCPATFEAWQDPASWETLKPQKHLRSAHDGSEVKPHRGSIAYNDFRKRWVVVFVQEWGKPSALGEVWYAEADAPTGTWGPAVKVLSHRNYTFYNPRLHPEFTPADSPILLFEGTHSQTFADRPQPTPRHDYNQILYRLDLDDPKLAPAQISGAR